MVVNDLVTSSYARGVTRVRSQGKMMTRYSIQKFAGSAIAICLVAAASPAFAQVGMSDDEIMDLPPEYQEIESQTDQSDFDWSTDSSVDADGVETVVRTRRITRRAPPAPSRVYESDDVYTEAPAVPVLGREAWIEECERRTRGLGESEKGGIIGGLLGAVFGGVVGNRVAGAGDRLAGTIIGAGAGGLGGALLGGLIGGGKKDGRYDCEAALDGYLANQHATSARIARRVIARPGYGAAMVYPGYAPMMYPVPMNYGYGYPYSQAQVVYVPVTYEQPQQVIIRENVREETYEVPRARVIEQREYSPAPRMIKQGGQMPSTKMIKQ